MRNTPLYYSQHIRHAASSHLQAAVDQTAKRADRCSLPLTLISIVAIKVEPDGTKSILMKTPLDRPSVIGPSGLLIVWTVIKAVRTCPVFKSPLRRTEVKQQLITVLSQSRGTLHPTPSTQTDDQGFSTTTNNPGIR